MTLPGKKNHYGVKLLRGYGCSIRLKDNKVVLRNGTDVFTGVAETEEWFVTQMPYERIVISGKGYLSTEAIGLLSQKNINIILLNSFGNMIGSLSRVMSSDTATRYRMGQYDTFRNPEKVQYLQNEIVKDKLESQIAFLKSLGKIPTERIHAISKYLAQLNGERSKKELLVIESRVGNLYFRTYAALFDEKYGFDSRRGGGINMSNRYAADVINGLLNYGYSVLAGEIAKYVNGLGLDPYYGFYHKADTSFQALVYDLIEPFRWLVEYAVYKLAVDEPTHGRIIRKDEYAWTKEGTILLDSNLIRRFLEFLERILQRERPYAFRHGLKREDGKSMCQELTIAKIRVQELALFCLETHVFKKP